ncbi:MAG: hypothetical protein VX964_06610, partial [Verrucomicrobiota bacterium]|nr:hypothetical protein [Verrucomicrobiota bacterium]
NPRLLKRMEFMQEQRIFKVLHVDGSRESINLEAGKLAFTYCQVPFIYKLCETAEAIKIEAHTTEENEYEINGNIFPQALYKSITNRDGIIRRVEVIIPSSILLT